MRNSIIAAVGIVALFVNTSVFGENNSDEARIQFNLGVELFENGKNEQASIAFERAYELKPHYKILWNIAQVENELGHYAAALQSYTRYLLEGGDNVAVDRREAVQAEIQFLRVRVGMLKIHSDVEGATVFVDGKKQGKTPLGNLVYVDLGEHEVVAKMGGDEIHREVVRVAGSEQVVVNILAKGVSTTTKSAQASEVTEGRSGRRLWTWVALGIGAATGITGATIGGVSMGRKSDIDGKCTDKLCPAELKDDHDTVRTMSITADVLYGVAGAGAIAFLVLYFTEPKMDDKRNVVMTPTASSNGAGLAVMGRF